MAEHRDGESAENEHWPAGRRVWFVAAEATPFIKVGGLADVAGELPRALHRLGVRISLCLPFHGGMKMPNPSFPDPEGRNPSLTNQPFLVKQLDAGASGKTRKATTLQGSAGFSNGGLHDGIPCKVQVWLSDVLPVRVYEIPGLFGRENVYAYSDDAERFAVFCLAVAADAETEANPPDILHLNDWHAAPLAMLVRHAPESGEGAMLRRIHTLLTIHSLEYQGLGRPSLADLYGLGPSVMGEEGASFSGGFNALKAGIAWSDAITTVSPSYAREILKPGNGFGLDSFLAERVKTRSKQRYAGILNRLGTTWNPAIDEALVVRYDAKTLLKRRQNKAALQEELGLPETMEPLAVYIGRLVETKGIGLLLDAVEAWLQSGMQLVILGTGEGKYQERIQMLSEKYPNAIACRFAFDERLARRMYGAADLLLMPSRREACGLSQQIAMRYGCLPVVRKTGGLKDTVKDGTNGFVFSAETTGALDRTVRRAWRLFREDGENRAWHRMMQAAMQVDSGWVGSARTYLSLYLDLLDEV